MTEHNYSPRDHLLGRLREAELDRADERSISDRAYFEELTAEEQLLIEEYVSGDMSAEDQRDFERQTSIRPELRERVLLERMSRERAFRSRRSSRDTWTRILLPLAASIAIIALGSAFYLQRELVQQRRILAGREHDWQTREAGQRARIAELEALARAPEAPPAIAKSVDAQRPGLPVVASFFIKPYTLGEGDEQHFPVPKSSGRVELQFNLGPENRFTAYRIVISKADGPVVSRMIARPKIIVKEKKDKYRVVSASVPTNLAGQHFEASVAGIAPGKPDEIVASYAFALDRE